MNSLTTYALNGCLAEAMRGGTLAGFRRFPSLYTLVLEGCPHRYLHVARAGARSAVCLSDSPVAGLKYSRPFFTSFSGAKIAKVETLGLDRVIIALLKTPSGWSEKESCALRIDLMGPEAALAMFEEKSGRIISPPGSSSRIRSHGLRDIPPGRPLSITSLPPEPPPGFTLNGFQKKQDPDGIAGLLLDSVAGLDPFLSRLIVQECGGDMPLVWKLLRKIGDDLREGNTLWHVYPAPGAGKGETVLYPLALPSMEHLVKSEDFAEACAFHWKRSVVPVLVRRWKSSALKEGKKELKKLKRLKGNLSRDLHKAGMHSEYRRFGNLLAANYPLLKRGQKKVTLTDFDGEEEVSIPLDEKLGPEANIAGYFKRARKGEKGEKKIARRLKKVEKLIEKERKGLKSISELQRPGDILRLIQAGPEPAGKEKGSSSGRFRRYRLDARHTVYVGRSAKENDLLTHAFASRKDLWFHARGVPGSHVLLKGANQSTPPEILKKAASIAAYFSKSRNSEIVPVSYTEKRYVRKPRKSSPGTAALEREKTLFVTPSVPSSESISEN